MTARGKLLSILVKVSILGNHFAVMTDVGLVVLSPMLRLVLKVVESHFGGSLGWPRLGA
jgi:hypothetical protein